VLSSPLGEELAAELSAEGGLVLGNALSEEVGLVLVWLETELAWPVGEELGIELSWSVREELGTDLGKQGWSVGEELGTELGAAEDELVLGWPLGDVRGKGTLAGLITRRCVDRDDDDHLHRRGPWWATVSGSERHIKRAIRCWR
jgi:hypothetical protein